MKKIFLFTGWMACCLLAHAQQTHGRRILLSPGKDGGLDIHWPQVNQYHPGDTLLLNTEKHWVYLWLDNYKGSPAAPLVIMNDSRGQAQFRGSHGIEITNSSYIKITGTGSRDQFGILLEGDPVYRPTSGKGVEAHMRTKNIELNHIAVHNMGFGFVCRTDNYCEDSLTYPNWVLDSISIHDCRIVGVWFEGMYIGNTSPDNAKDCYDPRPIVCHGDTVYPMPMRNGNTKIYDNYVDSTGRGGIQLASASTGMSEIFNNTVKHCGMNGDTDQGTGISVGAYTHVYIHDNTVINTFTFGIASIGGSGTGIPLRIEHNRVDSSGYLRHYDLITAENTKINPASQQSFPDTLLFPYAIELVTRPTHFTDSTIFWIRDNTVGMSRTSQAKVQVHDDYATIQSDGNKICGNKDAGSGKPATWLVDPGKGKFRYSEDCDAP